MEAVEALFVMFSVLWVYCKVQDWVVDRLPAPRGSRSLRIARIRRRVSLRRMAPRVH